MGHRHTPFAALLLGCLVAAPFGTTAAQPAAQPAARPAAPSASPPPRTGTSLTPEALDRSLELGRRFLLNCQRRDGSLVYEVDAERGADLGTRNAVREMGGLWMLALYHRDAPGPDTAAAILKALRHHAGHVRRTPDGGRYLAEPAAPEGSTNVVALHALALLDFLAADHDLPAAERAGLERDLADTVKFLVSLRQNGGRFASTYRCADGRGAGTPTPYSDGEALLALARAAKQGVGDPALRDLVLESAAVMYGEYVRAALRANPDPEQTKGFYQWGSMAFHELYTSGWPGTQPYAARTIAMARWMIDVHGVLARPRNTGYAYEGLAVAWDLARLTNDRKNEQHIRATIERGMPKLMTWQIGAPGAAIPKAFLRSPKSLGGVLSKADDPRLRIDMTQHQMHATLLTRRLLFRPEEAADGR